MEENKEKTTSEYLRRIECMECRSKTLRERNQKDWKRGEKTYKGYYPHRFKYLICDTCGKKQIKTKEKK